MFSTRVVILALSLSVPHACFGQFLTASGGASSLFGAYGGRLDYRFAPFSGWLGVGFDHGVRVGSMTGATLHGMDIGAGDNFYPFLLDTDIFERSYYFDGRGLSVSRHNSSESWTVFAGTTTSEFSTPFLRTFQAQQGAGAFFYQRKFGPRITLHSSNILSRGLTSIHSVGIAVTRDWKLDAAAGIGTGQGFLSVATEYKSKWLTLAGSWTAADDRFQRFHVSNSVFSERRGANVEARLTPMARLSLTLAHDNIAPPVWQVSASPLVSLDAATLSTFLAGFGVSASESVSRSGSHSAHTQLSTVSRRLSPMLSIYGSAVQLKSSRQTTKLILGTVQGKISPRLTLDGTVTRTASQTSFSAGGQFLSNRVVIGIHNQTVVNLLADGFNGRAAVQAWTVSLQVPLSGGVALHCDSALDGYGKVRYTAYATGLALAGEEHSAVSAGPAVSLGRYAVRGFVRDEKGNPIWGIALQINGELLYSDSAGAFLVRLKKNGIYRITVLPEQALNRAGWEVLGGSILMAQTSNGNPLLIIMRHRE